MSYTVKQPKTPEELRAFFNARQVEEVECIVSDIAGITRGKAMPAYKFSQLSPTYLPETIFFQSITGNYFDFENDDIWTEQDLNLVPDLSTLRAIPWAREPAMQVIHDIFYQDGTMVEIAPRNVLKKVLKLYEDKGWKPIVAPEMEFYLVKKNIDPVCPLEPPVGRSGRQTVGKQAYSMLAIDDYEPIVEDIYDFAEAQGLIIDTIIQEDGPAQLEINLQHGEAIYLADQVFFFKRLIREAAFKHNCYATFMAKPMDNEPGSAMHIHQSIVDSKTGKNIFNDAKGNPTPEFYHFIGGQQQYVPSALCIFAPYVNSFRRMTPDTAAPINVEWGKDNRTVGIRVPASDPESRRVENRIVGADANPYLALAASLACGYLGLVNKIDPSKISVGCVNGFDTANEMAETEENSLPRSLYEALDMFNECDDLKSILGERFSALYNEMKLDELAEYNRVITPWERKHLLLSV